MKTRPLSEESEYTCDWGGCNAVATAERLDEARHQWLSVCPAHGSRPPRPPAAKGSCSACGREYTLNATGRLRLHNDGFARCPGSGREGS